MRNWIERLILVVLLLVSVSAVRAQDNASMTGVVTDATGAVVPGATVVLVNPARGIHAEATTDKDGSYRFPNVPPAPGYKATFTHGGFSSVTVDEISLLVGITRTQNATLIVGSSTTVEVSARAGDVTLNTTDASIGNNFDVQLLEDLPIQNRATVSALFVLQPGVTSQGSVTGARTDQSSVTVDGMDVNDISTGQFGNTNGSIPADAVQEFRGTVAGLPANVGTGSGGQFQLVTKSGTNRFHGNLNEYHRDTATVANLYFNKNATTITPRPSLVRNQFGGNIGGFILRDKLFFFADLYSQRQAAALSGIDTVPLDSYKAGNISYVKAGCPSTTRQTSANAATCIGTITPAQVASTYDPKGTGESATIFSLLGSRYPSANDLTLGDGLNTGGLRFTQPTLSVIYDGVAHVDYNITSRQRVFLQYHEAHQDSVQSINRFPGDPLTRPFQDRSYGYVGSYVWEIGANKVNQFYYGNNVTVFNFPVTYAPTGASYFGSLSGILTTPFDQGNIQKRRVPIPTFRDDFNWTLGTHTLSMGGTFKPIKASNYLGNDFNVYTLGTGGNLTSLAGTAASSRPADLSTNPTNQAQYDNALVLALGRVGRISSIYNFTADGTQLPSGTGANRRFRYYQTEVYVGDTWKVNKQLTMTYGLRYSHYSVPYETLGAQSTPGVSFDSYIKARIAQSKAGQSGNTSVPLFVYNLSGRANNAPDFYAGNFKDFAPRLAVAYNPSYLPRTVFNASADIVYDRTVANAVNFLQNQSTFLFQNSTAVSYGNPVDSKASLISDPRIGSTITSLPAPPTIAAPGKPYTPNVDAAGNLLGIKNSLTAYNIDPNLKDPYNISLNAGVQQEFPGRFILRANYVGRLGRRLLAQADASQLIDFPDQATGQSISVAFANITAAKRAQVAAGITNPNAIPVQPWFEHIITPGAYVGKNCPVNGVNTPCTSNTAYVTSTQSSLVQFGDITDVLAAFQNAGLIQANVGIADQFARNTFYTNKGSSNYHGLLVSLSKNLSQGVKFDLNYTWQHSIDNVSAIANSVASGTGFLCDALNPRACRGNSDFDVTTVVSSDFVVQLPVGRGRQFLNNAPWYVNEVLGGWDVSGTPIWQSGFAYTTSTSAFFSSFANNVPAIYDQSRSDDVATHVNKDALGRIVAFNDVNKALSHFRGPLGIEYGSRNPLRGPSQFYMDAGVSKKFPILPNERLTAVFRADFYNVLNHPTFATPNASITSASFGQISATQAAFADQANRVGQFSLRLEF